MEVTCQLIRMTQMTQSAIVVRHMLSCWTHKEQRHKEDVLFVTTHIHVSREQTSSGSVMKPSIFMAEIISSSRRSSRGQYAVTWNKTSIPRDSRLAINRSLPSYLWLGDHLCPGGDIQPSNNPRATWLSTHRARVWTIGIEWSADIM